MSTPSQASTSFVERYQFHFGLGLVVAVVVGLLFVQVGASDGPDASVTADEQVVPPMPSTTVEVVENKIIKQETPDYEASLRLSTVSSPK